MKNSASASQAYFLARQIRLALSRSMAGLKHCDRRKIIKKLSKEAAILADKKLINGASFDQIKVYQLWKEMTLIDKVKWFLLNKLFKDVGSEFRKAIDKYNYSQELDIEKYPCYIEPHPKSVVVSDIVIKPVLAINEIKISFTVGDTLCK